MTRRRVTNRVTVIRIGVPFGSDGEGRPAPPRGDLLPGSQTACRPRYDYGCRRGVISPSQARHQGRGPTPMINYRTGQLERRQRGVMLLRLLALIALAG